MKPQQRGRQASPAAAKRNGTPKREAKASLDKPFADPTFLKALGRVTISFALLDGTLSALLHMIDRENGIRTIRAIGQMEYSRKVERFIDILEIDSSRLEIAHWDRTFLNALKGELNGVGSLRNSLMHNFWTIELETRRLVLRGLTGKGVPDAYPTPEKMQKLSDRIYEVRSRLAKIASEQIAASARRARMARLDSST